MSQDSKIWRLPISLRVGIIVTTTVFTIAIHLVVIPNPFSSPHPAFDSCCCKRAFSERRSWGKQCDQEGDHCLSEISRQGQPWKTNMEKITLQGKTSASPAEFRKTAENPPLEPSGPQTSSRSKFSPRLMAVLARNGC